MATTSPLRAEAVPDAIAPARPELAAFTAGRPAEDRLVDLLAFALATEQREPVDAAAIERLRHTAGAALGEHAVRYLHNNLERIRQEAVAEQLGRQRRPPGILAIFVVNLLAIAAAAGAAAWLQAHPDALAPLLALLARIGA